MKQCSEPGCDRPIDAKMLCKMHFKRWRRNGTTKALRTHLVGQGDTPEERFWSRVAITANPERCWNWLSGKPNTYGAATFAGRIRKTHMISWFLTHGYFSEMCILHSCDNPKCVNPGHLREGTVAENNQDKVSRNRQARGTTSNRTHLTDADIIAIRQRHVPYRVTQTTLAKEYDVCSRTILDILKRKTWAHVL